MPLLTHQGYTAIYVMLVQLLESVDEEAAAGPEADFGRDRQALPPYLPCTITTDNADS